MSTFKKIPVKCPLCGNNSEVDENKDAFICPFCGEAVATGKASSLFYDTYIKPHIEAEKAKQTVKPEEETETIKAIEESDNEVKEVAEVYEEQCSEAVEEPKEDKDSIKGNEEHSYCMKCGRPVDPAADYCEHCGTPLTDELLRVNEFKKENRFCYVCGMPVDNNSDYCQYCGTKLADAKNVADISIQAATVSSEGSDKKESIRIDPVIQNKSVGFLNILLILLLTGSLIFGLVFGFAKLIKPLINNMTNEPSKPSEYEVIEHNGDNDSSSEPTIYSENYVGYINNTSVLMRTGPGTDYPQLRVKGEKQYFSLYQEVNVIGRSYDKNSDPWYQCVVYIGGIRYEVWTIPEFITRGKSPNNTDNSSNQSSNDPIIYSENFIGYINETSVLMRTGPSTDHEQLKVNGEKQYFELYQEVNVIGRTKDKSNNTWYECIVNINGNSYEVWTVSDFITKGESPNKAANNSSQTINVPVYAENFIGYINETSVLMRTGPGTDYAQLRINGEKQYFDLNQEVNVIGWAEDKSNNIWYECAIDIGGRRYEVWTTSEFITRGERSEGTSTPNNNDNIFYEGLVEYTDGTIVIRLPADYYETDVVGYDYSLANDYILVYVSSYTRELMNNYGYEDLNLHSFTDIAIGDSEILMRRTLTNCEAFGYYTEIEGKEYYDLVANYKNNDTFYIVDFICNADNRGMLEDVLLDYADKVSFR